MEIKEVEAPKIKAFLSGVELDKSEAPKIGSTVKATVTLKVKGLNEQGEKGKVSVNFDVQDISIESEKAERVEQDSDNLQRDIEDEFDDADKSAE